MPLGGEQLSMSGMAIMEAMGTPQVSMFENGIAYDQDSLFVGGGLYWDVTSSFGVGATYVHALWYRNTINLKSVNVSLSFKL